MAARLHRETLFLPGLDRELCQFGMGMAQIVGIAARLGDAGLFGGEIGVGLAPRRMRLAHGLSFPDEAAERVDQHAVMGGFDERAVIVLAVNFDEFAADRPHRLHAHRLIVDEGAGAAVGHLHAPQDEVAGRLDVVAAGCFAGRVIRRPSRRRR